MYSTRYDISLGIPTTIYQLISTSDLIWFDTLWLRFPASNRQWQLIHYSYDIGKWPIIKLLREVECSNRGWWMVNNRRCSLTRDNEAVISGWNQQRLGYRSRDVGETTGCSQPFVGFSHLVGSSKIPCLLPSSQRRHIKISKYGCFSKSGTPKSCPNNLCSMIN